MNYQNITLNATSLQDLLKMANTTTNDTFWTGVYWMIIAIILLSSTVFGFEISIILSFFGGMLIGIFLLYLDLISFTYFAMTEAILLFFVIYMIYTSNKNQ